MSSTGFNFETNSEFSEFDEFFLSSKTKFTGSVKNIGINIIASEARTITPISLSFNFLSIVVEK